MLSMHTSPPYLYYTVNVLLVWPKENKKQLTVLLSLSRVQRDELLIFPSPSTYKSVLNMPVLNWNIVYRNHLLTVLEKDTIRSDSSENAVWWLVVLFYCLASRVHLSLLLLQLYRESGVLKSMEISIRSERAWAEILARAKRLPGKNKSLGWQRQQEKHLEKRTAIS